MIWPWYRCAEQYAVGGEAEEPYGLAWRGGAGAGKERMIATEGDEEIRWVGRPYNLGAGEEGVCDAIVDGESVCVMCYMVSDEL